MTSKVLFVLVLILGWVGYAPQAMAGVWRVGGVTASPQSLTSSTTSSAWRVQNSKYPAVAQSLIKTSIVEVRNDYFIGVVEHVVFGQEPPDALSIVIDNINDPVFYLEATFDELKKLDLRKFLPRGVRGLAVSGVGRFALLTFRNSFGRSTAWATLKSPTGRGILVQGLKYGLAWGPTRAIMLSIAKSIAIRGLSVGLQGLGIILLAKDLWYGGQWFYGWVTADMKAARARELAQSTGSVHEACGKHAEMLLKHIEMSEPAR